MGIEAKPKQYVEKNKFLNRLDEAFGLMCIHISRDIQFHLKGLKTLKEAWEDLGSLFGKQDELRGHNLENGLIALEPSSFETIQQFFTKYKALVLQCKQCGLERKDEQLVFSVINNLGSEYSIFVSTFHSERDSIPNWKMPSLDAFVESLIQEQDKLVQMGVIQTSKN